MADTALPFCDAMNVIAGEKLSSVTFVLDYWQLDFDGHGFSVYTWLSVHRDGKTVRSGASGFRDGLCERIAKVVKTAKSSDGVLTITFEDNSVICAFARNEDYTGPEAIQFQSYKYNSLYVL